MDISENHYSNSRKTLWVLALFCIAAFFLFLGSALFNTRGEPREAIVAVSMIDNGDWILPVNNGTEIAFKPPLLHWCVAAASTLTGAVTEYTSRLPSALSLCLMTLCLFAFFAKRSGERTALLTALITLTNFEVHRAGYACRVDMLLAALMVLALLALYRWWERGLRGVPWGAAACLAGAALTKGPVGVLLPCACAGLFYLLRGVRLWSAVWRLTLVALAALLPLAAWYCAAYMQPHGGERFLQLIYEENVLRLIGKMTYESHINPWWYNVQTILTGMLPYTLLLFIAPFFIRRGKSAGEAKENSSLWQKVKAYYKQMPAVRLYAAVCTAVIFVFYCIPASKRSTYLLPLYPFLSYFVAEGILWLAQKRAGAVRAFCGIVAALGIVLTLLYICVLAGLVPESIVAHGRHADQNL
ncbi:MAG: ArnT family glycosyltransferase, partial [Bacteroidales bacterium]